MTFIVKGMKIPECCGDCPFCDDDGNGGTICKLTFEDTLETECGLVKIPEKHGKLIDCDSALETIKLLAELSFYPMFSWENLNAGEIDGLAVEVKTYAEAYHHVKNAYSYLDKDE